LLAPIASLSADSSVAWVPLTVLAASLAGSSHCVGMCGGLVTSICRTRWQWIGYQAGRMAAYLALGASAGALGHQLLGEGTLRWLAWVSASLMALAFFGMAARARRGGAPHFALFPNSVVSWFYRKARGVPVLLGMLSAALPCGWLQSFVLAAAATQSAWAGAGLMWVFWMGTLPALSAAPWIFRRLLHPSFRRAPKVTAVLLILAGLGGVGFKMSTLFASEGKSRGHCNHAMSPSLGR
jgi:sulfite exporter TauE/SafE